MVKIKDFTLASQNLGGGHVPPVPYAPGAHGWRRLNFGLGRHLAKLYSSKLNSLSILYCK